MIKQKLQDIIDLIIVENNPGSTDDMQVDLIEDGDEIEKAKSEMIDIILEL